MKILAAIMGIIAMISTIIYSVLILLSIDQILDNIVIDACTFGLYILHLLISIGFTTISISYHDSITN